MSEPEPSGARVSPANFVLLLRQCAVTEALFQPLLRERGVVVLVVFSKVLINPNTHYIAISTSSHGDVFCC